MQSYNDVVTRNDANNALIAIGGATVTVYLADTLTVATIYSDDGVTTKANPFTANSDGTFVFYAPSRKYDVKSSFPGYSDKTITLSSNSLGAMVYNTGIVSIPNNAQTVFSFTTAALDTNGFFTSGSRLTIPAGVSRVRITANSLMQLNSTGDRSLYIFKNGGYGFAGVGIASCKSPSVDCGLSCSTGIISVTAGDYFEIAIFQTSGAALNIYATFTSMALEVIQ